LVASENKNFLFIMSERPRYSEANECEDRGADEEPQPKKLPAKLTKKNAARPAPFFRNNFDPFFRVLVRLRTARPEGEGAFKANTFLAFDF
jgi:hypothetical protein